VVVDCADTAQLMDSLQRNAPVADAVSKLSDSVKDLMTPDQLITTVLWDIVERLANLRGAIAEKAFSPDHLVPVLLQLDTELENWRLALPSSWGYQLRSSPIQNNSYTHSYHDFPSFSKATTWNQYRVARCLVNELLLDHLDSSHSERIKATIRSLCTDICASVPYFFRQTLQHTSQNPGIGAIDITWSLFFCGSTPCLPEKQRLWAVEQLEKIGGGGWISQALTFANLAKSKITLAKGKELDLRGLDAMRNSSYDGVC
jgi:hypothetical protein